MRKSGGGDLQGSVDEIAVMMTPERQKEETQVEEQRDPEVIRHLCTVVEPFAEKVQMQQPWTPC